MTGFTAGPEREQFAGAIFSVTIGEFTGPSGERFERDLIRHPGAVAVVAVTADQEAVLVRQYRPVVDAEILEIPAGKRDQPDEAPEVTARRELAEETGLRAGRLAKLAEFYNSVGFCDELSHLYLAEDLEPVVVQAQSVEERYMTSEHVPLADVHGLVASGEIVDAKTIIGLTLAVDRLRTR